MLSFDNTEHAFAYRSNRELLQAKLMFGTLKSPYLTKIGVSITNWALKIGLPVKGILKSTLYKQFVGGENLESASQTAQIIYNYGVGVILDYGVEGKTNEQEFDEAAESFIDAIRFASGKKHIPFVSIKVTGFARFSLLEKLDAGELITPDEQIELNRVKDRLDNICTSAAAGHVMILIDAEETWVQAPVDQMALDVMRKFNQTKAVVFNTYQMYRHDRLAYVKNNSDVAKKNNFILGAKLVRGAYMEKERARAEELNYESPIQPNKESCDKDYNEALSFCIHNHQHITTFIGTHNEASCMLGADLMTQNNLKKNSPKVYFSQLYGMSDNISFNLAHEGYNVSKYLPYGPVEEVAPYLMRRAMENTSVKGQTGRELGLIEKELKRRKL
jgi:proline dehydrogenase